MPRLVLTSLCCVRCRHSGFARRQGESPWTDQWGLWVIGTCAARMVIRIWGVGVETQVGHRDASNASRLPKYQSKSPKRAARRRLTMSMTRQTCPRTSGLVDDGCSLRHSRRDQRRKVARLGKADMELEQHHDVTHAPRPALLRRYRISHTPACPTPRLFCASPV